MSAPLNTAVKDPYRDARAASWRIVDASRLTEDAEFHCDVAIVGTGAGGGTAAAILAAAGLSVVLLEEGPLKSSSDFRMRESDAYPQLYQESAGRRTRDKAITILQGRCVGGGTTVNWTSSFRTPEPTLAWWAAHYGITGFAPADLVPYFSEMEARLSIGPWTMPPNANNEALARGAARIGIPTHAIRRNVESCWNLGYCGVGCPVNAKRSMLVTTIPDALDRGATLVTRVRALELVQSGDRVSALRCAAMDEMGVRATARRVVVHAATYVSSAGAIGSPGLLLRSRVPDPHGILGKRTFLHPTIVSAALMPDPVHAYAGAPQTIYSDHFLGTQPIDGPAGFKLEAPPLHPILGAITLPGQGREHAQWMREFPNLQVVIALLRDGFSPESTGGTVGLDGDGAPVLDYPLTPFMWDGVRRALRTMAEIQFAAGATAVMPIHGSGASYRNFAAAGAAIDAFDLAPLVTPVFSAHVMGGCPLGPDPGRAVVDSNGRHHQLANLYVFDGSVFPTSIGANPQLSIYGIVARLAHGLASRLAPGAAH
jgi:choline dehydrogenase-like flavoprotein